MSRSRNKSKVNETFKKISENFNIATSETNSLATKTFNTLNDITQKTEEVRNRLTVLADMMTDLRVLNGSAKNIINLSELNVVESRGITLKEGIFSLSLTRENIKDYNYSLSTISSINSYKLYNKENKETYLDNLFKTEEEVTLEFQVENLEYSLNLFFDTHEQINNIEIGLGILTESYPMIESIQYLSDSNELSEVIILNNNSRNFSLDEERVYDNLYSIDINPIITNQIIVNFSSKDSNRVSFKKFKTSFKTLQETGEIILGPAQMDSPILKVSVDSLKITPGVQISVSMDKDYWIPLDNASSFGTEEGRKILSINTVGNNSIKNNTDVYSLYFKIFIESKRLSNEDLNSNIYNTYREDSSLSPGIYNNIEDNKISAYRVSSSNLSYGRYQYNSYSNFAKLSTESLEYLEINGISKVIGLVEGDYSVTTSNNKSTSFGSVGAQLKAKRLPAEKVIDASYFDASNSKIFDIFLRDFEERINIIHKDNLCLYLKEKEDIYTIISSKTRRSLFLDLTTPFSLNSYSSLLAVPKEEIIIKNSVGDTVKIIPEKDLLEYEGQHFISLVDILYFAPVVEGQTYSKLYPVKELQENEYGLRHGKIVSNTGTIFKVKSKEIIKEEVEVVKVVNTKNFNYMKRVDDNFTYYKSQIESHPEARNVFKLNNVSIERGSLILQEHITGEEFYQNEGTSSYRFINVGTPTNQKYLKVKADTYLQE